MHTIASRPLAAEPLLAAEHADRPIHRLGLDTVLADLHRLGDVRLEVIAEHDPDGATVACFACVLEPRTGVGGVRVRARSALDAALGCQLEALGDLAAAAAAVERGLAGELA